MSSGNNVKSARDLAFAFFQVFAITGNAFTELYTTTVKEILISILTVKCNNSDAKRLVIRSRGNIKRFPGKREPQLHCSSGSTVRIEIWFLKPQRFTFLMKYKYYTEHAKNLKITT